MDVHGTSIDLCDSVRSYISSHVSEGEKMYKVVTSTDSDARLPGFESWLHHSLDNNTGTSLPSPIGRE